MVLFSLDSITVESEYDSGSPDSILVIILKCETKLCDSNISKLKKLFSDPYFDVKVFSVNEPSNLDDESLKVDQIIEKHNLYHALK